MILDNLPSEKAFFEMVEPNRPIRISAYVYSTYNCESELLIKPKHFFGTCKHDRSEFIRTMYRRIKGAGDGYQLDKLVSVLSGNQHVLQINFLSDKALKNV
ncbi:hypothetical protein M979_4426 [Buttiauxella noackiae ATCC 51607]|uniref:Uncharacterized protein n=1 Tax=Buttiauxella noackiae ATCC 51607 TaxID=1354255 RepID=A0A1B7HGD5_9ENTR|nr:hypothetical protein [Buttiauxella noackiae]OAT14617.1 hypothetical protein M979_4426 [Buttiauxella noackiae ATCC 51607]